MLKFIFTLMFCLYSFSTNAFIINNKTGKTLAVFFHKRNQILPAKYHVYFLGSYMPGRKNPIEIYEEPKVVMIDEGRTEFEFQEDSDSFEIIYHDVAIKNKIEINGSWGNVYFDKASGTCIFKSTSIGKFDSNFKKLKSDSTILEVVRGKEKHEKDAYEFEVLNYSFRTIEDEQLTFSQFLARVVKLCAIL